MFKLEHKCDSIQRLVYAIFFSLLLLSTRHTNNQFIHFEKILRFFFVLLKKEEKMKYVFTIITQRHFSSLMMKWMHSLAFLYFFEPGMAWLDLAWLCYVFPRSLLFSIILFRLHCTYKSGATMQRHEWKLNLTIIIITTIELYSFALFEMRSRVFFSN